MNHITQEQAVALERQVAAVNGDTLKDIPEKETIALLHGLCNAAIQQYIDSKASEPAPSTAGELAGVEFIEPKADNECADAFADGWNACLRSVKNQKGNL